MVQHWPFVILVVYALDLGLLLLIGKVPLAYNLRNVRVRWKTNAMTAVAFTGRHRPAGVPAGVRQRHEQPDRKHRVPGNVFVLSDGSNDEIFSNLGYGDLDNVERAVADLRLFTEGPAAADDGPRSAVRVKTERDGKKPGSWPAGRRTTRGQPADPRTPTRRGGGSSRCGPWKTRSSRPRSTTSACTPAASGSTPAGWTTRAASSACWARASPGCFGQDLGKKKLQAGDTFTLGDMDLAGHRGDEVRGHDVRQRDLGAAVQPHLRPVRQGEVHHAGDADRRRHPGGGRTPWPTT